MSNKTAAAPTAIEAARADLDAAASRLAVLRAEQGDLPGRLETATQAVDVDEVLRVQARRDRLPTELLAAQVVVVRCRMRLLEAQRADPAHADARARAYAELEALTAQLAEVQAAVAATQAVVSYLRDWERDLAMDIGACKRELSELTAQLAHAGEGPIVRARFLARGQ